jgi:hypothetical protein
MSRKRSVWKNQANGKTVRRNQGPPPDQQWSWWTIAMLESPAYRVLSVSAHRVIARIRIELGHHGGKDNGKLPVTYKDFQAYGIHPNAIGPAIHEAEALGWTRVTEYGLASPGEFRRPTKFGLTHLPLGDAAATNDWQKIETLEQAHTIAATARKQPSRYCRLPRRKKTAAEKISNTETVVEPIQKAYWKQKNSNTETVSLRANTETVSLSISGYGGAGGSRGALRPDSPTAGSS